MALSDELDYQDTGLGGRPFEIEDGVPVDKDGNPIKSIGNADETITIYRVVPEGVDSVNANDWVFINKSQAEEALKNANANTGDIFHLIEMEVSQGDVYPSKRGGLEMGYSPKNTPTNVVDDLDDFLRGFSRNYADRVANLGIDDWFGIEVTDKIDADAILKKLGFSPKVIKSVWLTQLLTTNAHHKDATSGIYNFIRDNIPKNSDVIKDVIRELGILKKNFPKIPSKLSLQNAVVGTTLGKLLQANMVGDGVITVSTLTRGNLVVVEKMLETDVMQTLLKDIPVDEVVEAPGYKYLEKEFRRFGDNMYDVIKNIVDEFPKAAGRWISDASPLRIDEEAMKLFYADGSEKIIKGEVIDNTLSNSVAYIKEYVDALSNSKNGRGLLKLLYGDNVPDYLKNFWGILDEIPGLTREAISNLGLFDNIPGMDVIVDLRFDKERDLFLQQKYFDKLLNIKVDTPTKEQEKLLGQARDSLRFGIWEAIFGEGSQLQVVDGTVVNVGKNAAEASQKFIAEEVLESRELVKNNNGLPIKFELTEKVTEFAKNNRRIWEAITGAAKDFVDKGVDIGKKVGTTGAKIGITALAPGDIIIEEALRKITPRIVGGVISSAALTAYISYEMALLFMDVSEGLVKANEKAGVGKNKYAGYSFTGGKDIDFEEVGAYEQADFSDYGKNFWSGFSESKISDEYSIGYGLTKEIHNKLFKDVYGRIAQDLYTGTDS